MRLEIRSVDIPVDWLEPRLVEGALPVMGEGEILFVHASDYLDARLDSVNRDCLAAHRPWMLFKSTGTTLYVGPFFRPDGPCWNCLATRLRLNGEVREFLSRQADFDPTMVPRAVESVSKDLVAALLAKECEQQFNGFAHHARVITFDITTTSIESHALVRRPQCSGCGTALPSKSDGTRIGRFAGSLPFAPGYQRTASPLQMLNSYRHHVSPLTGIVRTLEERETPIPGLSFTYSSGHNFALAFDEVYLLNKNLKGISGGKGASQLDSRASALGEALERYSGIYRGEEEREHWAAPKDLGDSAVPLNNILLFSDRQYADRHKWNSKQLHTRFHVVPNPLSDDDIISWSPVSSLCTGAAKFVPTGYCYYGHPDSTRRNYFISDSNGCASGNTIEEAIFQAFMELAERDAVAIWWYNRLHRPAVLVNSFPCHRYFSSLRDAYLSEMERDLWVLDLTSDLNVPTFAAISARRSTTRQEILMGFGSHLDANTAIVRALTELNQLLHMCVSSHDAKKSGYRVSDPETIQWLLKCTSQNQPYVAPDLSAEPTSADTYPHVTMRDVAEQIDACITIALAAELDILFLDQTRPDVEMPVCRLIVPGLRHFWRRLGSGRLYEVPVKLGWLAAPLNEDEMNPVSMFF